jgi:hypothetical protein
LNAERPLHRSVRRPSGAKLMRDDPVSPKQFVKGLDVMGAAHEQNGPRVQLTYALQPASPSNLIGSFDFGIDLMRIRNGRKGGRIGFAWVSDAKRLLFFN